MRVLDLFSGIGLMSLGLHWSGMTTVGFCEIDDWCRKQLARNYPGVWIHDDIRTLTASDVRARAGAVDLIAGGFPCQPASVAGKRKGEADERWLWPEMRRLVSELRPRWVLAENVPGLRTRGADRVLADLEELGYARWPLVVGADDVGAPQRRKRVWIVAISAGVDGGGRRKNEVRQAGIGIASQGAGRALGNTPGLRCGQGWEPETEATRRLGSAGEGMAHADCERLEIDSTPEGNHQHPPAARDRWPARPGEPQHEWEAPRLVELPLGNAVDGRAGRLARRHNKLALKALGNAVVPQVVERIGRAIMANP